MCEALITKGCSKCGEVKPLSDFYNNSGTCKVCTIRRVKVHRELNLERIREYDRRRRKKSCLEPEAWEARLEASRRWSKANPVESYAIKQRYIENNPKKRDAHVLVGNAIRDGRLHPQPCKVCGKPEVHGHHCDYDKPLDVLWLCAEHHAAWHVENGEGLNAH